MRCVAMLILLTWAGTALAHYTAKEEVTTEDGLVQVTSEEADEDSSSTMTDSDPDFDPGAYPPVKWRVEFPFEAHLICSEDFSCMDGEYDNGTEWPHTVPGNQSFQIAAFPSKYAIEKADRNEHNSKNAKVCIGRELKLRMAYPLPEKRTNLTMKPSPGNMALEVQMIMNFFHRTSSEPTPSLSPIGNSAIELPSPCDSYDTQVPWRSLLAVLTVSCVLLGWLLYRSVRHLKKMNKFTQFIMAYKKQTAHCYTRLSAQHSRCSQGQLPALPGYAPPLLPSGLSRSSWSSDHDYESISDLDISLISNPRDSHEEDHIYDTVTPMSMRDINPVSRHVSINSLYEPFTVPCDEEAPIRNMRDSSPPVIFHGSPPNHLCDVANEPGCSYAFGTTTRLTLRQQMETSSLSLRSSYRESVNSITDDIDEGCRCSSCTNTASHHNKFRPFSLDSEDSLYESIDGRGYLSTMTTRL